MGLVGFGTIGKQVARLARAMGLRVMALRRTHGDAADVEVVHGAEGLGRLMREADYVVIAAPLTPKTRGMVGADELALMKPSGVLINVGRGKASPPPAPRSLCLMTRPRRRQSPQSPRHSRVLL